MRMKGNNLLETQKFRYLLEISHGIQKKLFNSL